MASSTAATVSDYLKELPEDRRKAISRVRSIVRKNLPEGYSEGMSWGMISWFIPLKDYPDTYNGQPLCIAGLASQKNFCTLYLMGAYMNPAQLAALKEGFRKAGKKLDMGKSCIHFKQADDLPLDTIAEVVAAVPPEELIELNERSHPKKPKRPSR